MTSWNINAPITSYYDHTTQGIETVIKEVMDAGEVAIDTETTGLNRWKDVPLYWSLAYGSKRMTLNVSVLPFFTQVFADPTKRWIFANAKYDAHILANVGINIAGSLVDTQVMHALLYEDRSHRLKDMNEHLFGWRWSDFEDTFGRINKEQSASDRIKKAEVENFGLLIEYAANDAWGTLQIYLALKQQLQKAWTYSLFRTIPPYIENLWDLYDKIERPYTKVLWKNERNGILIDQAYLAHIKPQAEQEITRLEQQIFKEAGYALNPNSPTQLRSYFFGNLGLKSLKKTKGGKTGTVNASVDSDFLEYYASSVPMAALVLEHRKLSKLYGTYIVGLTEMSDQYGRVHTTFNQDIARTGRLSSKEPNLQNIPRPENDRWKLRGAFIASPGKKLIVADYCVAPTTRILTADLKWESAAKISVQQDLIGFDEKLSRSGKYRHSKVTGKKFVYKESSRITMSNGATLVVSNDHQWVVGGGGHTWKRRTRQWVRTDELVIGDQIAYFCEPWEHTKTFESGYLSGILDGEGWVAKSGKVGFAQKPNICLDVCKSLLKTIPIKYAQRKRHKDTVQTIEFYGNKGGIRALGMLRPPRLLQKADLLWNGKRLWGGKTERVFVRKIERIGRIRLVALQTESKTFIAEGFLSHNCQLEMRLLACASLDPGMIDVISKGWDIHMGNASLIFGIPYEEIKAAKKTQKMVEDRILDQSAITPRILECLTARNAAKTIGFALVYGLGVAGMAKRLNISNEEAAEKVRKFKEVMPAADEFKKEAIAETQKTGFSFTVLGRRRSVFQINSSRKDEQSSGERIAVNTPIQGSAADVVKMAQLNLDGVANIASRFGCLSLLQVHDELVHECPEEYAEEAKGEIKEWMEAPFSIDLAVPLTVDINLGYSWLEAK